MIKLLTMKKIYVFGAVLFTGLSVLAQENSKVYNFSKPAAKPALEQIVTDQKVKPVTTDADKAYNVIWNEDFTITSGMTTSKGTWTPGGTNGSYWTIAPATGNQHPLASFNWTENLAGSYLKWNSYGPNANEAAGFATTTTYGWVESPTIDLTTAPAGVMMEFKTEAMYCCHTDSLPFKILISTNGGTSWSDTLTADFGVGRNDATQDVAKPLTYVIDLSAYTSGANATATTKIKFIWVGDDVDANGQKNTHYFWLIDDVKLFEKPTHDVVIEKLWLADIVNGFEHTEFPASLAGTLTVQAKLRNLGANIPTTTQIKIDVYNSSNAIVAGGTATGGTLSNSFASEYDTITFNTGINLSTLAIGTYTARASMVITGGTDANTDNDTIRRTFVITDFYLGQRNYNKGRYIGSVGQDAGVDAGSVKVSKELTFGNVMYIPNNIDLDGIEVTFGTNTNYPITVDQQVIVKIFEYNPTATDFQAAHVSLGSTVEKYFTLTSSMIPTTGLLSTVLNFHQSEGNPGKVSLTGGKYYLVGIYNFGGDQHIGYAYNKGDDDYSSHIFGDFGTPSGNRWFTTGDQALTRMVFNPSLGIDESNEFVSYSNIYPNPTNNNTNVAINLKNNSTVTVQVIDITGKVVYTAEKGELNAGAHSFEINSASLNSGVYYVNITTNGVVTTKKLVKN